MLRNPGRYSWRSSGSALTTPGEISVEFSKSIQQQLQRATVADPSTDSEHRLGAFCQIERSKSGSGAGIGECFLMR